VVPTRRADGKTPVGSFRDAALRFESALCRRPRREHPDRVLARGGRPSPRSAHLLVQVGGHRGDLRPGQARDS